MTDEEVPRLAPPPKPTVLQMTVPRPEVPEISLMFDSDDSLIWQRPGHEVSKNTNRSSSALQQQKVKSFHSSGLLLKATPPMALASHGAEKENYLRESPQVKSAQMSHNTPVQRFISSNIVAGEPHRRPGLCQSQDLSSPTAVEEMKNNNTNSKRQYNPLLYSPSQKMVNKVSLEVASHVVKCKSPLATRNENILHQKEPTTTNDELTNMQTSEELTLNSVNLYGSRKDQSLPAVKKVVHFDVHSQSLEAAVRPKVTNACEKYVNVPVNRRKDGDNVVIPSAVQNKMYFGNQGTNMQTNTGYINSHLLGTQHSGDTRMHQARYGYSANQYRNHIQDVHVAQPPFNAPPAVQPFNAATTVQPFNAATTVQPINAPGAQPPFNFPGAMQPQSIDKIHGPRDPSIYQLIEDQNQHILRLYKTLESFLDKRQPSDSVINTKDSELANNVIRDSSQQTDNTQASTSSCNLKHVATQTAQLKQPVTRSVGVNTDFSWPEILSLGRPNNNEYFESNNVNGRPIGHRNINQNASNGGIQRNFPRSGSRERAISKQKNSVDFEQQCNSEVKEISLIMREVVMTTIQEDQQSPEPSLHINMEEYREDSVCESYRNDRRESNSHGTCMRSPELGESASMYNRNNQDFPHYNEHEANQVSAPAENLPTGTFYNNVLTNIQQILQSSREAEEEEEQTGEQNENNYHVQTQEAAAHSGGEEVLEPQIEAVKRQLLQFGISFIDPSSLALNHRPVLDTMYIPGLHNMLVYESTIVAPYQNVYKETDATAAKYLTDNQLAAIASMSPVMQGRSQNLNIRVRGRDPSVANDPGDQFRATNNVQRPKEYSTYDDNLSMATKKFLGKYGLTDKE